VSEYTETDKVLAEELAASTRELGVQCTAEDVLGFAVDMSESLERLGMPTTVESVLGYAWLDGACYRRLIAAMRRAQEAKQ
jgi:hypothetical protein